MFENGSHEKMQSAYRTAHSTESALIRVQNDILRQLDKQELSEANHRARRSAGKNLTLAHWTLDISEVMLASKLLLI